MASQICVAAIIDQVHFVSTARSQRIAGLRRSYHEGLRKRREHLHSS